MWMPRDKKKKVKIEFTFISEERLRLFDSRERSNHMRPKYKNNIDSLRSQVGGSGAQWFVPRGQSEASQLELSLKSHAFQKFTDLLDTH